MPPYMRPPFDGDYAHVSDGAVEVVVLTGDVDDAFTRGEHADRVATGTPAAYTADADEV